MINFWNKEGFVNGEDQVKWWVGKVVRKWLNIKLSLLVYLFLAFSWNNCYLSWQELRIEDVMAFANGNLFIRWNDASSETGFDSSVNVVSRYHMNLDAALISQSTDNSRCFLFKFVDKADDSQHLDPFQIDLSICFQILLYLGLIYLLETYSNGSESFQIDIF